MDKLILVKSVCKVKILVLPLVARLAQRAEMTARSKGTPMLQGSLDVSVFATGT